MRGGLEGGQGGVVLDHRRVRHSNSHAVAAPATVVQVLL